MEQNGSKPKKSPRPIEAFKTEDGKTSFIQVPRFWVDALMEPQEEFTTDGGQTFKTATIPNSFWKFTLILWRYITDGNVDREAELALSRFYVRRDAAVRWTAAYAVSGLFEVVFGSRSPEHDDVTEFRYETKATEVDWRCFILALTRTLDEWQTLIKSANKTLPKNQQLAAWSNTGALKVLLAMRVDAERKNAGLSACNDYFLLEVAEGKVRDQRGRLVAIKEGGSLVPQLYAPVSKSKK